MFFYSLKGKGERLKTQQLILKYKYTSEAVQVRLSLCDRDGRRVNSDMQGSWSQFINQNVF